MIMMHDFSSIRIQWVRGKREFCESVITFNIMFSVATMMPPTLLLFAQWLVAGSQGGNV